MLGGRRGWEEWKGALCVRDWCELIDGRPQYEKLSAQGHGWKAKPGTPVVKCHILICHCASIDACGGVWEHLTVRALSLCGLTPVGNRLRRLIFPLPVPVDRVSRARWEAEISSGAVHREPPRCTAAPHACNSSHAAPEHATASGADACVWPRWTCPEPRRHPVNTRQMRWQSVKCTRTFRQCPTVTVERALLWVYFRLFIILKSESCQESGGMLSDWCAWP